MFTIIPLWKSGTGDYLYMLHNLPVLRRFADYIVEKKGRKLSHNVLKVIKQVSEIEIPKVQWTICEESFKDTFWFLDQKADDVRCILNQKLYNLPRDNTAWWMSHFTNNLYLRPEIAPQPSYQYCINNNVINFKSSSLKDTWIYLVSKKRFSVNYALDFFFKTETPLDETLQICFRADSLAKRYRFIIKNNMDVRFDIVDKGFFLASYDRNWAKFKHPFSLFLNVYHHIRFECYEKTASLWIDDKLLMAIESNNIQDGYFFLIFWNGIEYSNNINISIKDFKLLIPSN